MRPFLLWFLCLLPCSVHSFVLSAEQGRIAGAHVDGVRWQIDGSKHQLQVKRLQFADLALDGRDVRVMCTMEADSICVGTLTGRSWSRMSLSVTAGEPSLRLGWPKGSLHLTMPEQGLVVNATALPLAWMKARAKQSWGSLAALEGQLDLALTLADPIWRGTWQARELTFDQDDGQIAGAGVDAQGTLQYKTDTSKLDLEARLTAGELLLGPIYRQIGPPLSIQTTLDFARPEWSVDPLVVREGDHLALNAAATFSPDGTARQIDLRQLDLSWPRAQPWIDPILASANYPGLELTGRASLSGRWRPAGSAPGGAKTGLAPSANDPSGGDQSGGWDQGQITLDEVTVHDPQGRIEADGLNLSAQLGDSVPLSSLRWQGLRLFGLPVSAGVFEWAWQPHRFQQTGRLSVETLGGTLDLSELSRVSGKWEGSLSINQLDFATLSERFGWPAFGGRISANLSHFKLYDGQIDFPGEILVNAFDGQIGIKNLTTERLLGDSPALAADIRMNDLDLSQVTAALSFGEIQGRMDGYINGLRLLDWSPIAFDARLQSERKPGVKQRISRRAVEGLSRIGGAGLNNALVGLVDSFGYAELGIACRLKEDVCTMDGVDSDGRGYTIVQGSGLPRLTVNGYQRQVNWPVMVRRLQAAASGTGPIID